MKQREVLWTVDGDETSWGTWAEEMAEAPASALMEELIQAHKMSTPGWALDLGCGTGRAFLPLNQAGYHVVGVEANPKGIQLSRERVRRNGLRAWPLRASAAELPLGDSSIDFVFALGILFHLSPKELAPALGEIRRVMKANGKAILHFLDREDWRKGLAKEVQADKAPFPSYRAVVTCFCTEEIIEKWVNESGLKQESITRRARNVEAGEQLDWIIFCAK